MSSDGRRIAGGYHDKLIYVWDTETGELLHCLTGPEGEVLKVAWSSDGRRILSESASPSGNTLCAWDSGTGECLEKKERESSNEGTDTGSKQLPPVSIENLDTLIQDPGTQRELGWLPGNVRNIARHPSAQVWAGFQGDYVCMFTLEGNVSPTS
jgi:WD40 repeat protein